MSCDFGRVKGSRRPIRKREVHVATGVVDEKGWIEWDHPETLPYDLRRFRVIEMSNPIPELKIRARANSESEAHDAEKSFISAGYKTFVRKELSPTTGHPTGKWEVWGEKPLEKKATSGPQQQLTLNNPTEKRYNAKEENAKRGPDDPYFPEEYDGLTDSEIDAIKYAPSEIVVKNPASLETKRGHLSGNLLREEGVVNE